MYAIPRFLLVEVSTRNLKNKQLQNIENKDVLNRGKSEISLARFYSVG